MANTKKKYEIYKNNQTREKNKIRKFKKILKRHPNDIQLQEALEKVVSLLK